MPAATPSLRPKTCLFLKREELLRALTGHDYDRIHGPPTPEKFRMYRNLVATPAFLIMIGSSATVFL
jgi:hypothetical protein